MEFRGHGFALIKHGSVTIAPEDGFALLTADRRDMLASEVCSKQNFHCDDSYRVGLSALKDILRNIFWSVWPDWITLCID